MEIKMVQVWPKNEAMRKLLKHPHDNVSFREEGPSDWPDDSFTHRRVMDGDIVLEDPDAAASTTITPPSGGKTK
jgi:hypothetical protein